MRSRLILVNIAAITVVVGLLFSLVLSLPNRVAADETNDNTSTALTAAGKPINIVQSDWKPAKKDVRAIIAEKLPENKLDSQCGKDDNPKVLSVKWGEYAAQQRVAFLKEGQAYKFPMRGDITAGGYAMPDLNPAYINLNHDFISTPFTSHRGETVHWNSIKVAFQGSDDLYDLSYRIVDAKGSSLEKRFSADSWKKIERTSQITSSCDSKTKINIYELPKSAQGHYLQYKIHLTYEGTINAGARLKYPKIERVSVELQPMKKGDGDTGTGDGTGKITIVTRKIVEKKITTQEDQTPNTAGTTNSAPLPLPDSTNPTPLPTVDPVTKCGTSKKMDDDPDIEFTLSDGKTKLEDKTDKAGEWQGADDKVGSFPTGRYTVKFGDDSDPEYQLAAICISPGFAVKSELDVKNKTAVFVVKKGLTAHVNAYYTKRKLPHVSMTKLAISDEIDLSKQVNDSTGGAGTPDPTAKRKVLNIIYPGQRFSYLIRYTATTEADAQNVVIRDVIPWPLRIPDDGTEKSPLQKLIQDGFKVSPDIRGHTLVTKTIGTVKAGTTGSIIIPVELPGDADLSGGAGGTGVTP